jgi:hypothetical protein
MSSPSTGDISNSNRDNSDLPLYEHTYVVYPYNFRRTNNQAIHNYGHQLESILGHVDWDPDWNKSLFWKEFVGRQEDGSHVTGRCGWTHMPPNTTDDYDYYNTTVVDSDIADWRPDGLGATMPVNVDTWERHPYQWPAEYGSNPPGYADGEAHWYIYWMQSMPGRDNGIPNGSERLTNWWVFPAAWDLAIEAGLKLSMPVCDVSVSFTSAPVSAEGGEITADVLSQTNCPWVSSSNNHWIRVGDGRTGEGSGTVRLQVQPNAGGPRAGSVAIAGKLVTIRQESSYAPSDGSGRRHRSSGRLYRPRGVAR